MAKTQDTWTIELPDVHPSLNSWGGKHWTKRNELHHYWRDMTFYAAKKAGLPKLKEPVEVFLTYYHPRTNVDLDNYTPKFIMDGLKLFFIDDSIAHVKRLGWEFKKGDKRTVITIKRYAE